MYKDLRKVLKGERMNQNKEQLRELWSEFKRQLSELGPRSDSQTARMLYDQKIWPLTREGFTDKVPQSYSASFHTVGTTPEPVILSAKALDAQRVYLLHTKDTEQLCTRIGSELGWGIDRIKPLKVKRSDPEDIYRTVREQVDQLEQDASLAFDPTGGTKAMVAGLAMFAFSLAEEGRKVDVYYVDNEEYDDALRRPVAGTEFLKRLDNPREVFADWIRNRALDAYRRGDYVQAKRLFAQAAEREGRNTLPEELLANAYAQLDAAQFDGATQQLGLLGQSLNQPAHRQNPLRKYLKAIEEQKQGLEEVTALASAFDGKAIAGRISALADPTKVAWALAALEFMAGRRMSTGRFAEAALLRYRSLELFLQYRLALAGVDTAAPDYSRLFERLNPPSLETLQAAYQNERKGAGLAGLRSEDTLAQKSEIDFTTAFFLLKSIGDEAIRQLNANRVVGLTRSRNSSVFAHGFVPPTENQARTLADVVAQVRQTLATVQIEPIPITQTAPP